jgi:acyl-CoA thioester hydrolase
MAPIRPACDRVDSLASRSAITCDLPVPGPGRAGAAAGAAGASCSAHGARTQSRGTEPLQSAAGGKSGSRSGAGWFRLGARKAGGRHRRQAMTHRYPVEVHYEDTDMGGIVYHANFLKFTERARSAWVRELGIDQNAMRAAGRVFVVTRMVADFLAPAYFEDALGVVTRILRVTPARLEMAQSVWRGEAELFRAVTTLACLSTSGRPARLPAAILGQSPDQDSVTTRR